MKKLLTDDEKAWIKANRTKEVFAKLKDLPVLDRRKLVAMDPNRITQLLTDAKKKKVEVAQLYNVMENICFLSRSSASTLPNYDKTLPPIHLSGLTKKQQVLTVAPKRRDREEAEYQAFHWDAAR